MAVIPISLYGDCLVHQLRDATCFTMAKV
jgi:hypothetical protein